LGLIANHNEDRQRLFRLIVFILKMALAAVLGVVFYGAMWFCIADALILGRRLPWR
jgi:hypothetical protein